MVQMAGGSFGMDYDQETTYWKASCLSHDVVDIFRMMTDCALEPRSVVAANVGQVKNKHSQKLDEHLHTGEHFNNSLMQTAFGLKGLGLPLKGLHHNVSNLSAFTIQKFQLENINPRKLYIVAGGVENHLEFVQLVESQLGFMEPVPLNELRARAKTEYVGGEVRIPDQEHLTHIALTFNSVPWTHPNMMAFQVINAILGCTGSGRGRFTKQGILIGFNLISYHF
jgi:processing peptidase subunit beta